MLRRVKRVAVAVVLVLAVSPRAARAEAKIAPDDTKDGYFQVFATSFLGDGIRFNNPYRLATPLGSSAESLSRTAAYVDFGVALTLGAPAGLQHGVALRTSIAIEGVHQSVLTPSYLVWRRFRAWALYGRAGIPVVLSPDVTGGGEVGGGAVWFWRGGVGVAAEIVGDVIYGAGTREIARPAYPVMSAQLGVVVALEALP